jgi:hypothetical protein
MAKCWSLGAGKKNRIFKSAMMKNTQLDSTIYSLLVCANTWTSFKSRVQVCWSQNWKQQQDLGCFGGLCCSEEPFAHINMNYWPRLKMLTKTRDLKKIKNKKTKTCRKYHIILRVHHVKADYHVVADKFLVSSKEGLFQHSKYAMRREHQLIIQTIVAKYIKLLTKVNIPLKNTVNSCSIAPITKIL